ncbi:MAG: anaerobic sulfatase maturase [Oscillospiraceae bacterium]|nr:anaerobic sulfatase maturase [Oscillospiraceae bacterium]
MRCEYCFYADVSKHRKVANYGMMSTQTLETAVRAAFKHAKRGGACNFAFQGGEPTLAGLDFYKELIELQKKYNIEKIPVANSIQTNGYNIDGEWADFFAEHKFLVGLSLDGKREIHDLFRRDSSGAGTWDKVLEAASVFTKKRVEFNILCVVNNIVAKKGISVYNSLKSRGFRYIQFIPCLAPFGDDDRNRDETLSKPGFNPEPKNFGEFLKSTFDLYYNDLKNSNYVSVRNFDNYISILLGANPECCGMNGFCSLNFVVESDGSVYPCDFYVLDKYRLGNISTHSFEELAKTETARKFISQSYYIDDECKKCRWYKLCRGGCFREREPVSSDGKPSLNVYCKQYKEFFDHSFNKMQTAAEIVRNTQKNL